MMQSARRVEIWTCNTFVNEMQHRTSCSPERAMKWCKIILQHDYTALIVIRDCDTGQFYLVCERYKAFPRNEYAIYRKHFGLMTPCEWCGEEDAHKQRFIDGHATICQACTEVCVISGHNSKEKPNVVSRIDEARETV